MHLRWLLKILTILLTGSVLLISGCSHHMDRDDNHHERHERHHKDDHDDDDD
ncbi:MAG: hypothetical protein GY786_22715 [Proteobacteria bacterium]|nr:hypothetical protein [Pseudomonadota bacterium]